MPSITHQNKIRTLQEKYEKLGFCCKRNYPLYNDEEGNFSLIDLVCFKGKMARAFEVEKSGKQVLKNAKDLQRFKAIFKNSKICQMTPSDPLDECPDFKKKIVKR